MNIRTLISKSKNHHNFWESLEKNGGELLFEEYVAIYLKATLPGETYWLGEDVIPAHVAQQYRFVNLLKGKRSLGGDIINIHQGRAVAYESKWLKEKETINLKLVANKQQVINKTGIDQLIFATNARQQSGAVKEWVDEAAFLFQEYWITEEVYDTVKAYIKNQVKKNYKPMVPRDQFFEKALDQHHTDVLAHIMGLKLKDISLKIFQHWPAASGKGSFPRLAYDMTYEPLWDYKKSHPINLVVNPTLVVLKGNLVKQIEHDLALNNNSVHVIYAGDVTKGAKDTEELQTIRSMAKVFVNKIDFVEYIKTVRNQTVWVHTTVHSYDRLASVMKGLKKSFYFAHIDEVHHVIQPDWSSWTDCLDDKKCKIQVRFMSSANRRIAEGNGATYSMDDPDFSDIQIKDLDEKTAVALGYKRQSKIISYVYRETDFNTDWLERLDQGSEPRIRLKGTNYIVPLSWWMAADALLKFRLEHFQVNHTKLTLNKIEHCKQFAEFFNEFRKQVLKTYCDTKDPMYKRLMKAKIMVADTQENSTVKLLKEVSAIPDTYKDSFVIHCRLLGEGWDPANGWIDSGMFVDATWSEIRIYQDVNRGSRIGDGSKLINYIVMVGLLDAESEFNKMFGNITRVGNALEMGVEDIKEHVEFKAFKNMPKGKSMGKATGSSAPSYYDEQYADFLNNSLEGYIKEGRYYTYGSLVNEIAELYMAEFEKRHLYNIDNGDWVKRDFLKYEIALKYKEFFDQYSVTGRRRKLDEIVEGKDFRLSTETVIKISKWKEKVTKIATERRKDMLKLVNNGYDDHQLTEAYKTKFSVTEVDPAFMKGNEKYFGLLYSFDEEEFKFYLRGFNIEQAVNGNYEVI